MTMTEQSSVERLVTFAVWNALKRVGISDDAAYIAIQEAQKSIRDADGGPSDYVRGWDDCVAASGNPIWRDVIARLAAKGDFAEAERAVARAAISAMPGGGWQDIATAPKDGSKVLIAGGTYELSMSLGGPWPFTGVSIAHLVGEEWQGENCGGHDEYAWHDPTHWQPLPLPPAPAEDRS